MAIEDLPWLPGTTDVVPHLRQFLRDEHGRLQPDFDNDTAITAGEVISSILSTVADMSAATGPVPPELQTSATKTAAIGAAAEAVIDRDEEGRQLYRELRELFEARLARLIVAVRDARDGIADGVSTAAASGSFPEAFDVDYTRF